MAKRKTTPTTPAEVVVLKCDWCEDFTLSVPVIGRKASTAGNPRRAGARVVEVPVLDAAIMAAALADHRERGCPAKHLSQQTSESSQVTDENML